MRRYVGGMWITTSTRPTRALERRARQLGEAWGLPFVRRLEAPDAPLLVLTKEGLKLRVGDRAWGWNEGMIHTLRESGWRHPLLRLTGLSPGDTALDCTLGLGTDARFVGEMTGEAVVGYESVPALALMATEGLAGVQARVEVRCGDAHRALAELPDRSFDLVMADPMFPGRPAWLRANKTLDGIREIGDPRPLDPDWLTHALRVARKAVFVRDVRGGTLIEALDAPIRQESRRAARYGVWRLDGVSDPAPPPP